jgi:branched-chain amino acid transport system substrate-binding protein
MTRLWQLGMAVVLMTGLAGCGVAVDQRTLQTTTAASPPVTGAETPSDLPSGSTPKTSAETSADTSPETPPEAPSATLAATPSATPSATIVRNPGKSADVETDQAEVSVQTENATTEDEVAVASLTPSAPASIDDLLNTARPAGGTRPTAIEPPAPAASDTTSGSATGDGATIARIVPPAPKVTAEAPAPEETTKTKDDVVGDIIWNLESAKRAGPAPPAEPKIPVGPDPSLASDALEAAFAQIARREPALPDDVFVLPPKAPNVTRIALLIPVTGPNAALGAELQNGAELALFSVRNQNIELLVFDTHGEGADMAARQAVVAKADIMVGPLFSEAVVSARKIARQANIPMLALSNNLKIADRGSWLLGYVPEQQVDALLGYALTNGHNRVGIIAEDAPFGQILARHAVDRLAQFGLRPEDTLTLTGAMLADEDQLKSAIRRFTGYRAPAKDEKAPAFSDLPPSRFDALIFAGSADFALRTAPVLAYYDADSERVLYLGNAQWNQQRILTEPSLQGGVFASRPTGRDDIFNGLWSEVWPTRPGVLARLSFDAMAMATVLTGQQRQLWQAALESESGFSGFSGAYRLLPGGGNQRAFELRQIEGGVSAILQPAPDKI